MTAIYVNWPKLFKTLTSESPLSLTASSRWTKHTNTLLIELGADWQGKQSQTNVLKNPIWEECSRLCTSLQIFLRDYTLGQKSFQIYDFLDVAWLKWSQWFHKKRTYSPLWWIHSLLIGAILDWSRLFLSTCMDGWLGNPFQPGTIKLRHFYCNQGLPLRKRSLCSFHSAVQERHRGNQT